MKKTAFDKIILGFVLLISAIFAVLIMFMVQITKRQLKTKAKDDLYGQTQMVAYQLGIPYVNGDINMDEFASQAATISDNLDCTIWFADEKGNIIFASTQNMNEAGSNSGTDSSPSNEINPAAYIDIAKLKDSFISDGTFDDYFGYDTLTCCQPIYKTDGYAGSIIVHESIQYMESIQKTILGSTYMPFLIIVVIALVVLMLLTNSVIKPLREIIKTSQAYAIGNFNARTNITADNEFGELARSMEQMADELSRSNEYRKTFISNISHDFKSPLTSIKGYIEAMLDGTIPPENYNKYLNIVLNETKRLTKLTQGLLELNTFDSFDLQLDKSNFDLKSVIQPTINTFEGRCQDRDIYLHAIYFTDNTMVYADRTKIQQVIYNLVDNAIKFTPEGRQITIQVTERHDKIYTSVKDEGIGISPDAQKKVFDRFYKTDPSRGKDKVGNGLGLAIIKEIIRAHGENITLESTLGEGSEFIFSLPKQKEMLVPIKPVHNPEKEEESSYISNGKFKIKKN